MIPPSSPVVNVFRQYAKLYAMRNSNSGFLDSGLEKEWQEIQFTLESIFSGMYQPSRVDQNHQSVVKPDLRAHLPLQYLRVPTETDVLCETPESFFPGKFQDISTGGAYVHASVPLEVESRLKLTFCTFRDELPLEIVGRVAWNNPRAHRKRCYLEGAGVEFVRCDVNSLHQLEDFVYELVEETLVKANLI